MVTFLNPHYDDFLAEPVVFRLLGRRALKKYGYLLEGILAQEGSIFCLVDDVSSSLIPYRFFVLLPRLLRRIWLLLELALWKKMNHFGPSVKTSFSLPEMSKRQTLLLFSYKNCTDGFSHREKLMNAFQKVVVHLSHYMIRTSEKASHVKRLQNAVLAGDTDISRNAYFHHYFGDSQTPFLVVPFFVADRFSINRAFNERPLCCVATGSFHDLTKEIPQSHYADFMSFFKTDTYHPVRKLIYQNKDKWPWLTCLVSPYREGAGFLSHFKVGQKTYFGLDMVSQYNQHRYAIVGEEAVGFPALGAFEAMACGCVVLTHGTEMYHGLGLQSGVHYAVHDGTVEGIQKTIMALEKNPDIPASISQNAATFIAEKMRREKVFEAIFKVL